MNKIRGGAQCRIADDMQGILDSLRRMGLVSANSQMALMPLAGGVSSDIYRVEVEGRIFCVKRALPKLKVAAEWHAPVERNRWEVEWMRIAAGIAPTAVPAILGTDAVGGAFAMAYLSPDHHPTWKTLLASGRIEMPTASAVGDLLGRLHAATADSPEVAQRFPTDPIFYAIRLEPYLIATGRAHPDLADTMAELVATTRSEANARVLVHGDFSPKNILVGPHGPVILDAECAWYGDPAFDVAFVLTHLLLKGAWQPAFRERYLEAFAALIDAYFSHVTWEPKDVLEARCAALLPALLLARVDGKSPVEYLSTHEARDAVRQVARQWLRRPCTSLQALADAWRSSPPDGTARSAKGAHD